MKWHKFPDVKPEESKHYLIRELRPGTAASGFFQATPSRIITKWSRWTYILDGIKEQTPLETTFHMKWGFFDKENTCSRPLTNIVEWADPSKELGFYDLLNL